MKLVEVDELWRFWLPVPVVLVSTVSKEGFKNVAPYCMIMQISEHPPMVGLGIRRATKTYKNIFDNGEFVINVPSDDMVGIVNMTADRCPPIDKFEKYGLTPVSSLKVKAPKVGECKIHFECKLMEIKDVGGDHDLIIGEAVAITVSEDIVKALEQETKELMKPIFYGIRYYYALGRFLGTRDLR